MAGESRKITVGKVQVDGGLRFSVITQVITVLGKRDDDNLASESDSSSTIVRHWVR